MVSLKTRVLGVECFPAQQIILLVLFMITLRVVCQSQAGLGQCGYEHVIDIIIT